MLLHQLLATDPAAPRPTIQPVTRVVYYDPATVDMLSWPYVIPLLVTLTGVLVVVVALLLRNKLSTRALVAVYVLAALVVLGGCVAGIIVEEAHTVWPPPLPT